MAGRSWFLVGAFLLCHVTAAASEYTTTTIEGCEEVFVGAGWAGVYSFYRRIMEDPSRGPWACLFEESWRIGGRTYTVPINHTQTGTSASASGESGGVHFVQDVGAYRFTPDMHLPGDLILHDLKLETECYAQYDCQNAKKDMPGGMKFHYDAPLRRIIDPTTKLPKGYVTPLRRMIAIAESFGGRVFVQTPLVGLTTINNGDDKPTTFLLEFKNTSTAMTTAPIRITSPSLLVLNLPRHKLLAIQGVKESLEPDMAKTLECVVNDFWFFANMYGGERDREAERQFVTTFEKAYLYYSDAWWHTVLDKPEGFYPAEFPAMPSPKDKGLLFNVRFHDGPVSCDDDGHCQGLLQIYYDSSNETVYRSTVAHHSEDPLGSVWATDGPDALAKLMRIHKGLMETLRPLFLEAGIQENPLEIIKPPLGLVVGVWNQPTSEDPLGYGYTAPTKVVYYSNASGLPEEACGVSGLTDGTYRDRVLQPWGSEGPNGGTSVFLVNNDWVCNSIDDYEGDWAEESLLQAERAMYLAGTSKPWWLSSHYYKEKVVSRVTGSFASAIPNSGSDKESGAKLWRWHAMISIATLATLVNCWFWLHVVYQRKDYTAIN